ncbi:TAT-binding protein-like protein 7, AAA ATPase [Recurvomyces mirabilis]|uniref:TAT-binding protein-like protein 7, AAA ATPase n=1 Tax=Recurvomyces mirabilis TaxID=574656 RepID=A0AAE0WN89_9PEZI|nr:TAT-binding protein-like protein 7, AAA ATPase [Recurvomyces mirabilis]KAK5157716.1 TAT-binding protein-like protein 7, AAA ATPase [Recurvomyces mirabilis]
MSKRKLFEQFDPTKSDSDDETYGAAATSSPRPRPRPRPRPQGRSSRPKPSARSSNRPAKRRREKYGDSEDDIEADSDEISEEEEDEEVDFAADSDADAEEVVVETNPRTGRSVRSVAKKPVKYEDPSEDDIEAVDSEADPLGPTSGVRGSRRGQGVQGVTSRPAPAVTPSLVLKLKVPSIMEGGRSLRTRTGGKSIGRQESTPAEHRGINTRRSSRISHDDQEPLVALTDSGRHEQVTRAGTATPEPEGSRRPTRGGKGLKKPPSAIMEASQEDSQPTQQTGQGEIIASQLADELGVDIAPVEADALNEEDEDMIMERVDEEDRIVQESMEEDDDEDEAPIKGGRSLRQRHKASTPPTSQPILKTGGRSLRARKSGAEPSSDFDPEADAEADVEENLSESDDLLKIPRGDSDGNSRSGRRSGRLSRKTASQRSRSRRHGSDEEEEADEELDPEEIADEAAELDEDARRNKRTRKRPSTRNEIAFEPNLRNRGNRPDYRILRPELLHTLEEDENAIATAATPQRNRRTGGGGGAYRSLFSTMGPFGGAGGPLPVFGGPDGAAATGGVDSDSSDDEARGGQQGFGGTVGMTPTSAFPKPFVPPALNSDPIQGPGGGPPGLGKVKDKKALADADPLGVDPNVSFDGVGGLDDHIDRLKEMVALPLLYPEVFQRFHVTPPRGVLFHGPPGTGKTLLARALASSVSSHGQKVTFYMRKGADALSKWVGEAEKQLRLLFEEARKNQPSIIFFDEIDGLAPVRSSKQEQIHASIVATLLALMDGMDGRGQVIVIGATNRPDSVDPALRRPGRFDREFYFALPDQKARRAIIDIHTKGWDPELQPAFKDNLAEITRGYGGADLRALCTEAALNAVQGTYPQIYASDKKLVIDPSTIKVMAKDFMISVNKIIPSSERSVASGAAPLKKDVEPLLRKPLLELTNRLNDALPRKRKATALEEAMYDDREDELGFERETMQRRFESARIFRPRLLIHGAGGMGQQYLGAALLSKFEGVHVQGFDMATLLRDSTRSPEAAIVQLFEEVKRHKPSVIYLPNVDIWYETLSDSSIRTFAGLLRGLNPTEPVLVLGVMDRDITRESDLRETDKRLIQDLFNYSSKNRYILARPDKPSRHEFFQGVIDLINKAPSEFPEPENRKRRKLAELPVAAVLEEPKRGLTKEEQRAQKKKDRTTLNMLKLHIQSVMDQIKLKYKKFRTPVIDDAAISYLYDEQNPDLITTDLNEEQKTAQRLFRPYELDKDEKGVPGLREVGTGKFYYNLEIVTIEKRLSNGYYKRPRDFLADIKRLAKDARVSGEQERTLKANEMLANVEVDMGTLEQMQPGLCGECEAVYEREVGRERERVGRVMGREVGGGVGGGGVPRIGLPSGVGNVPVVGASKTTTEDSGPVVLGQEIPGGRRTGLFDGAAAAAAAPVTPSRIFGGSVGGVGGGFPESANPWSTTNGSGSHSHGLTNGSSAGGGGGGGGGAGRAGTLVGEGHLGRDEDEEMLDPSQEELLHHQQNTQPGTQPGGLSRSQSHGLTRLAPGSQPENYPNSASTTTSGQKTSDKSHRSSGPYSVNSQYTNGHRGGTTTGAGTSGRPDFSMIGPQEGGSQLPDTQPPEGGSGGSQASASQPQQQYEGVGGGSQPMGPPAAPTMSNAATVGAGTSSGDLGGGGGGSGVGGQVRGHSSINALLNNPVPTALEGGAEPIPTPNPTDPAPPAPPPPSRIIIDLATVEQLHYHLTHSSSGCSVEQLEQISSRLMDVIWRTRGNWNRVQVVIAVKDAFNEVVGDIEACQRILGPSQP